MSRPAILVLIDHYLPAFRAGGPVRSIANLVERLSDEYDFRIVCRDRDMGDEAPFEVARRGEQTRVGQATVRYLAPGELSFTGLGPQLAAERPDVVYLNSVFSPLTRAYLTLRRLGRLPPGPRPVLAPRGELGAGALALKPWRKSAWLGAMRATALARGVTWHATSEQEAREIAARFPGRVLVAHNVPPADLSPFAALAGPPAKTAGQLRLVFLSRIARKKNLDYALRVLARVRGRIELDVHGTVEDPGYLDACRALAATLPGEVTCRFHGPVAPEAVPATLAASHALFFPTRHENFGHVILEALLAGVPALLSDQTYWRGLEDAGAGWDLALGDEAAFAAAVQRLVDLDEPAYRRLSAGARRLARRYVEDPLLTEGYRELFAAAPAERRPAERDAQNSLSTSTRNSSSPSSSAMSDDSARP